MDVVMFPILPVLQIAQADAHIVGERARETDGDADAKNRMSDRQRVQVAVVEK